MSAVRTYHAVVIGAGQAGGPLAGAFAAAGHTTLLIERDEIGGTCINRGCTPTKTLVASARIAALARRAGEYGVTVGPVAVDFHAVRERKDRVVRSFRRGSERKLNDTGAEVLRGSASFTGPQDLVVETEGGQVRVRGDLVFINVGARPATPPIPGLDTVGALDSTSIMELSRLPSHLLVLGGGYVGLEFAQMFRRFGSEVSLVESGAQLLGREDRDIADAVREILVEDGIEVHLDSTVCGLESSEDGGVVARVEWNGEEKRIEGSHLLVAVGRTPNTSNLGCEAAGIELDGRGFIVVDERLETSVPGVYALGDVNGGPAFTHISYDDYRVVRENLLEEGSATTRDRPLPYVVYIDPQLGRVGLSEDEARQTGRTIGVARLPMRNVARAAEVDETAGFMKAVVDRDSKEILGGAILGIEGGELIGMLQLAMMAGMPYTTLRDGVFAHPTLAEAFNNLFRNVDP